MTRRSHHLPLFAFGTLVLLVGEFCFGGLLHSASHRHRFCSEHGAFEEAKQGASLASSHAGGAAAVEQGSDEVEADHDRCPYAPAGQTSRLAAGPAWVVAPVPPARVVGLAELPRGFAPVDALACAPKASPPVRA